jgi:hypothetical protein
VHAVQVPATERHPLGPVSDILNWRYFQVEMSGEEIICVNT